MKLKMLALLIATLFLCSGALLAKQNEALTEVRVAIEYDFHHLGDHCVDGFYWECPDPNPDPDFDYLTSWYTEFDLDEKMLRKAKDVHIECYVLSNDWSFVLINGRSVTLPYTNKSLGTYLQWGALGKSLISFPLVYLQPGMNSIEFVVTPKPDGNHDDMEFGEVELVFSTEE